MLNNFFKPCNFLSFLFGLCTKKFHTVNSIKFYVAKPFVSEVTKSYKANSSSPPAHF